MRFLRLLLLASCLWILLSSGCADPGPGDATDLVSLLPADVDLVVFADIQRLRDHPLWPKVQDDPFIQGGQETIRQLEEATGLDPLRDFHMLLFAARNIGTEGMDLAMLARGDLNRGKLERALEATGWQPQPGGPLELYSLPFTIEGTAIQADLPDLGATRLAFVDDHTLAFGSEHVLQGTGGGGPKLLQSEDLGPLLHHGLGSGQFWGAFRAGYLSEQLRGRIEESIPRVGILKGFSGVEAVRFSLRFSDSIDLVARAHTGTAADAELLADTLNGFLALAKLAVGASEIARQQPELMRFLEGALVGLDLNSVRLSLNVDAATLERIRGGFLRDLGGS